MPERFSTFADKRKREVRVTFDEDGTAYYCGIDLGAISGYTAPYKVVQYAQYGNHAAIAVKRRIEVIDKNKRSTREFWCFTEEEALKFLDRRPAPEDVVRWFTDEVIPQVRQLSLEKAAQKVRAAKEPPRETAKLPQEEPARIEMPPAQSKSIVDRLDTIILECALLKRELCQR